MSSRRAWVDFARGLSILLVVLLHLFQLHYIYFFYGSPGSETLSGVIDFSTPLRMPLFFLVSGFLAAHALTRPWATSARSRVWTLVYLFGLWLVINLLVDLALELSGLGGPVDVLAFLLGNALWPQTSLWYIYALALFFVLTRLTRRIPASLVVGVAVVLSIVGTTFFDGLAESLLRSFVFYAVAARAPELVEWIVARWRLGTMLAAGLAAAGLTALYLVTLIDFGVYLLAGVAAVVFALQLSVRIGGHRLAAPIRFLGRRTLPIFLVHPFVFIVANLVLVRRPELAEAIRENEWAVVAYPWVLLVVTVLLCVGVEALASRIGLRLLFRLPVVRAAPSARPPR